MLLLILACKPLPNNDTGSVSETAVNPPNCAAEPGDIALEDAASVTIYNSELQSLDLGRGVSSCDLDGDGHHDLLVSGSHGPQRRGAIGVFYGPATDWPSEMDLSEADTLIQGNADYTYLGMSLDCGDLDGDGFADIVAANAEFLNTEFAADTDFGLHIWYGSEDRLPAKGSELEADASLSYDYGKESANRVYWMNVLVADLDGDGADEISLATNDSSEREGGRDRILILSGARHSSGLLTELGLTVWGMAGSDVVLSSMEIGEPGSALVLDYVLPTDPVATVLHQPQSLASGSYTEEHSWLDLEQSKSTDYLISTRSITGGDGPIFVSAAFEKDRITGFFLVSETLEEGSLGASEMFRTGEMPLLNSYSSGLYHVGDYNGDGVEDLGVDLYQDASSPDRYWAVGVLDGSLLGTPDQDLESLLLNRFVLEETTVNTFADQGFGDLDGDGCSDLYWGEPSYGAASGSEQDDGRVLVLLSSKR